MFQIRTFGEGNNLLPPLGGLGQNGSMTEVELKARGDLKGVRERLRVIGAAYLGEEIEEDLYLDHPVRSFAVTDEALRIRIKGKGGILTYKGPRLDPLSKSREELEVEVSDWRALMGILLRLGFREVGRVQKSRERYRLGAFVVCLDRVEGLGEFVEVEGRAEGDHRGLLQEALALMADLGLKGPWIRASYLEMLFDKARGRD